MRILISIAVAFAIMLVLVLAIVSVGTTLARASSEIVRQTPVTASTLSKVAFAVLWCLVAGTAAGLIGGS